MARPEDASRDRAVCDGRLLGRSRVSASVAQVLPTAELLVVTTPDSAASGVASRIGSLARSTEQTIIGVIENMSWLSTDSGERLEIFGSGGGERVAAQLSEDQGADVPLLGQVPLAQSVREGSDAGRPHTASESSSEAYLAFMRIAEQLAKPRGLSGRKLPLSLA